MPRRNKGPYLKFLPQRGCYYIQWSETGRTKQRSTGTSDSGQANSQLAAFIAQYNHAHKAKGPIDPSEFSIADALVHYATERAPETKYPERIGYAIKGLLPFWGNLTVGDISRANCKAYLTARKVSTGTQIKELGVLSAAVKHAAAERHITYPPAVHKPPQPLGKDRWLTNSEAAALLNAARTSRGNTRLYLPLFIMLALYTGARKEAILSLRWTQVDFQNGRINFNAPGQVQTNKKRAHIPIPNRLLTFLRLARRRGTDLGYVVHLNGARLKDIKKSFDSAKERAGIEGINRHTLRHTCATWMAQRGVPLEDIGAWLGHTDPKTTMKYAHHHPDYMTRAKDGADRRKA